MYKFESFEKSIVQFYSNFQNIRALSYSIKLFF